jgi:hypothetical protein
MLVAHQHDAHAEDIFLGHYVATEIAAARSPAILQVIGVVVINFVEDAFFAEVLD